MATAPGSTDAGGWEASMHVPSHTPPLVGVRGCQQIEASSHPIRGQPELGRGVSSMKTQQSHRSTASHPTAVIRSLSELGQELCAWRQFDAQLEQRIVSLI